MEGALTLESQQESIQDGGKCSECKDLTSSMNTERSLKSKEAMIQRTETSLFIQNKEESINNGILSMPTNGRENQLKDSSTRDSVSMLREISM
jgi:hypothetical protein